MLLWSHFHQVSTVSNLLAVIYWHLGLSAPHTFMTGTGLSVYLHFTANNLSKGHQYICGFYISWYFLFPLIFAFLSLCVAFYSNDAQNGDSWNQLTWHCSPPAHSNINIPLTILAFSFHLLSLLLLKICQSHQGFQSIDAIVPPPTCNVYQVLLHFFPL